MKQTFKHTIAVLVFVVISFALTPRTAFAYDISLLKDTSVVKTETDDVENRAQKAIEATSRNTSKTVSKDSEKEVAVTARQNRFNANQTKKCEKKQEKIIAKLDAISARGTKQLDVFHTIATRVQSFYIQKGYTADGYDALIVELDKLYDQSLVAVTSTQNASDTWGCNLQDPIASLNNFKVTKRAETATLTSYKDKIRELILLVKQAGETSS
jgi:hypothetical protein